MEQSHTINYPKNSEENIIFIFYDIFSPLFTASAKKDALLHCPYVSKGPNTEGLTDRRSVVQREL